MDATPPEAASAAYVASARDALLEGRSQDAVACADAAAQIAARDDDLGNRVYAVGLLATLCALNAEYRKAGELLTEATGLLAAFGELAQPQHRYPLLVTDSLLAAARFDAPRCLELADEFAGQPDDPLWRASSILIASMADYLQGRLASAKARLSHLLGGTSRVGVPELVLGLCDGLLADILIAEGNPRRALSMLEGKEPLGTHVLCFAMQRASALVALGRDVDVISATDACINLGPTHCMRTLPPLLLRRALAFHRLGHIDEADRDLAEAVALIELGDTRVPYMTVPRDDLFTALHGLGERHPDTANLDAALAALEHVPAPTPVTVSALTRSEREIARDLASGATLEEIARARFLSVNTVKFHTRSIYRKLAVNDRQSAISTLIARGELEG